MQSYRKPRAKIEISRGFSSELVGRIIHSTAPVLWAFCLTRHQEQCLTLFPPAFQTEAPVRDARLAEVIIVICLILG